MKQVILISLLLIFLAQATNLRLLQATCASNTDCPAEKYCNITSQACVECLFNSHCSSGQKCVSPIGKCGHECTLHEECGANGHCDYTTSPYHCAANQCVHDGDCPNSTCSNSLCVIPEESQPEEPKNDGTCTSDADCQSFGFQCITSEGRCGHVCASHQDCTVANTQCDYLTTPYSCVPNPCTHDGDCSGSTCSSGKCVVEGYPFTPECTTNSDCPQGQLCQTSNNTCVDPCTSDEQCGFKYYCSGICYPFTDGMCNRAQHCDQGQICYKRAHSRFGRCALQCSSHEDCRTNEICNFNADLFAQCVAKECVHSGDCEGESECVSGRCQV